MKFTLVFLCAAVAASAAEPFTITHQFANRNAHSLISLPMGSHKTLVEKDGSLHWSQWSLKRKPPDSPFGFSGQMDGALAIDTFRIEGDRETRFRPGADDGNPAQKFGGVGLRDSKCACQFSDGFSM